MPQDMKTQDRIDKAWVKRHAAIHKENELLVKRAEGGDASASRELIDRGLDLCLESRDRMIIKLLRLRIRAIPATKDSKLNYPYGDAIACLEAERDDGKCFVGDYCIGAKNLGGGYQHQLRRCIRDVYMKAMKEEIDTRISTEREIS